MRKNIKTIVGLIIAFIIGISTTVGAATVFNSKDIKYSSSATTKTNVKDSLDELYSKANTPWSCASGWYCYKIPETISGVNVGNYISMTPTSTSYKISKNLTGYTSDQTINPSELNLWRVIRKNEDGTVDIISEYVSSQLVSFEGKTGYINFIKGLNTIAAQYTDGKHVARTRHIGYSNQTETLTNLSSISKTTAPFSVSTDDFDWNNCDKSKYLCGSSESSGGGDRGFAIDYNLVYKVYGTLSATTTNGGMAIYWISSRAYMKYSDSNWIFFVRTVDKIGGLNGNGSLEYNGSFRDLPPAHNVRPIVTLKSGTSIASGEGSKEKPYTLS